MVAGGSVARKRKEEFFSGKSQQKRGDNVLKGFTQKNFKDARPNSDGSELKETDGTREEVREGGGKLEDARRRFRATSQRRTEVQPTKTRVPSTSWNLSAQPAF